MGARFGFDMLGTIGAKIFGPLLSVIDEEELGFALSPKGDLCTIIPPECNPDLTSTEVVPELVGHFPCCWFCSPGVGDFAWQGSMRIVFVSPEWSKICTSPPNICSEFGRGYFDNSSSDLSEVGTDSVRGFFGDEEA